MCSTFNKTNLLLTSLNYVSPRGEKKENMGENAMRKGEISQSVMH